MSHIYDKVLFFVSVCCFNIVNFTLEYFLPLQQQQQQQQDIILDIRRTLNTRLLYYSAVISKFIDTQLFVSGQLNFKQMHVWFAQFDLDNL